MAIPDKRALPHIEFDCAEEEKGKEVRMDTVVPLVIPSIYAPDISRMWVGMIRIIILARGRGE
jgi:hypothetical protein